MKSYQFRDYGQPLEPIESPTPEPAGAELLMRVAACGACHSDVHVWEGEYDMGGGRKLDVRVGRDLPFTLGHEIVGEVLASDLTARRTHDCTQVPARLGGRGIRSQFRAMVE